MGIEYIDLNKIKFYDFLGNISFPSSSIFKELKDSISNMGIQFPIIVNKVNKQYFLVDGKKRIKILNDFKKNNVPVLIFTNKISEDVLVEYCKKNSLRGFNDIEISNLIETIEKYFKNNESLIKKILEIAGKKYSKRYFENTKSLNKLSDYGKELYVDNILNKNLAVKIAEISLYEQNHFFELIKKLRLNNNNQKKCFNMLLDLSKRLELSFSELIKKEFEIFLSNEYSRDNEELFFDKLTELHSPNFYKYNKKFTMLKKNMNVTKKGINIYSPNFFEDGIFKLEVYFKSFKELADKLDNIERGLKKVEKSDEFKEFFD